MTDDEFVKEFCSKCINRKGFDDVCEIRKNIKGEPQCVNFEEEGNKEKKMKDLLFRRVVCKGYYKKKMTKYVHNSTIDDEYIEDDVSITLNQGGSCEQEIYEFVEKEFEGICVGIFKKGTKREFVDELTIDDLPEITTKLKEPVEVVKVYYRNNKSRIVPIDKVNIWKPSF